uniref:Dimethylaniline monooxygenase n=1 Tax=Phallusia mammillata TaxID=59560 RepID=A0A6F9DEK9_9ASCI|nr:dimethylaniline monooxygenase [Phallusia mammillata]
MGLTGPYDVVVVGAGPHALALLTRLLVDVDDKYEERPNNERLFSATKKGKFQTKVKDNPQIQRTPRQIAAFLNSKQKQKSCLHNICVVDEYGCWMSQWEKQFDVLGISHLRSTLFVHPDAFDLQSLAVFAAMQKRESEMLDISRSIRGSKFSGPFIIPSTALFWDFCCHIVSNYGLEKYVKKGRVLDIVKTIDCNGCRVYTLTMSDGSKIQAKNVVISTGNTTLKNIPIWAEEIYVANTDRTVLHSSDLIQQSRCKGIGKMPLENMFNALLKLDSQAPSLGWNLKGKNLLIVGGGLSSGHLAIKAAMMGAKQIHLVCRSQIKVRQFDLSLDWIGRGRFKKLADFFSIHCFEKRFQVLQTARNGGSITPNVHEGLTKLIEDGLLTIHEDTDVWSCEQQKQLEESNSKKWVVELSDCGSLKVDQVFLATGSTIDSLKDPLLHHLHKISEVEIVDGLPLLTEDLEWQEDSGLFVMGVYAALQLGPDALNIAGARAGASRIAYKLNKVLGIS